ncbi:Uncharacterised protein [Delftia tsuruhatensis]|nr:Uncharacterised protein [Delftia tsuruhatensis]
MGRSALLDNIANLGASNRLSSLQLSRVARRTHLIRGHYKLRDLIKR